jgi:hypothetical protein
MDKTESELREMLADRRLVRWPTEPQWKEIWLAANAKGYTGTVSDAVASVAPELLDPDWKGVMQADPEQGKMMWSEIRHRRSVSPFRKGKPQTVVVPETPDALLQQVEDLVSQQWVVVSDGPSGVQLQAPKKMKTHDIVGLGIGLVSLGVGLKTIYGYFLGIGLIGAVLIDYFLFTKAETKFLPRQTEPKPDV